MSLKHPVCKRAARLITGTAVALALVSCGGGGGGAADVPAPVPVPTSPLPNLRASADSPVAAGCTGGGAGTGTLYVNAEVEPFSAINPANPLHLLGTWQQDRWSNGGARAVVSAVSFDGGQNWARTLHPMSRCGGALPGSVGDFERASDPWIDIGADGTVHMMALAFNGGALLAGSRSAMLVSRSLDGGRTFAAPQVLAADGAEFFNDKNTLTADTQDARYVYAVWDRLDMAGNGPTLLARSVNAGASWEPVRTIYSPTSAAATGVAQTIGNRIVVLPGGPQRGLLVNVFVQIDSAAATGSTRTVRVIRSADKGSTWGPPITVAEHRAVGAVDPTGGGPIRDGSIVPAITVAADGTLWLAWQDARFSGGQRDAIVVSRSVDGGLTWSLPAAANRDLQVAAFTPTLTVRADGLVGLMHFDLRPNTTDTSTLFTAAWLLTSQGGVAWVETPVWPRFDLAGAPQAGGFFVGDYQGLVTAGADFLPLLAMSSVDTGNRTDIYPLRIAPLAAFSTSAQTAARSQALRAALMGALPAAQFEIRQQAFTQRALAQRRLGIPAAP